MVQGFLSYDWTNKQTDNFYVDTCKTKCPGLKLENQHRCLDNGIKGTIVNQTVKEHMKLCLQSLQINLACLDLNKMSDITAWKAIIYQHNEDDFRFQL